MRSISLSIRQLTLIVAANWEGLPQSAQSKSLVTTHQQNQLVNRVSRW